MQDLVGIVRTEAEMKEALVVIERLKDRARRASVAGSKRYNPGWHTAIDLKNLLIVSEAIAKSAIERKESRGGHFREDYPDKVSEFGTFNISTKRQPDGSMKVSRLPLKELPAELKQVIEEQKQ
jgi:succinate dehydrogenase / fumarate reductase flavoprotein subunit